MKLRTRLLLGLLALAISSAVLFIVFSEQPGYVLIAFDNFRYESSLWVFLAFIAGIWLVLKLLQLTIRALLITSGWLNLWSKSARLRRAQKARQHGLLAFAEGYFDRALTQLKYAANGEQPLLALLAAARAAQQLGDSEQSNQLLEQARGQNLAQSLAVDLLQAELQSQRGELDAACSTLQRLHQQYPHHEYVLRMLKNHLERQQNWLALQALLPALQKHGLLSEEERLVCKQRAACLRLEQAGEAQNNEQTLDKLWRELPKSLRGQAPLLITYANQLARQNAADKAEQLLHKAINRHYDSRLVACYGKLQTSDPEYQLKTAEGWLKTQPEDAPLLLALARLANACGQRDKTRRYYEAHLVKTPCSETYMELAQFLAETGENKQSTALFIRARDLLNSDSRHLPPATLTLQKSLA